MNKKKINLIKETFFNEQLTKKKLIKFISRTNKLSMGEKVSQFEKRFAQKMSSKYSVMFNSGSSSNLAIIQSLLNLKILKKNDYVGVSALNWSTTVMPLIQLGLKPYFIDIDINSLNISPSNLINSLSNNKNIKSLFLTNILGLSDDLLEIRSICTKKKIFLFEDNCESIGSKDLKNNLFGSKSACSSYSFFVGHHMSTIEGGAVTTNNYKIYQMLKLVRAHGWIRNLENPKKIGIKVPKNNFYKQYTFFDLAYNLRPTEIQGFLGLEQLKYLSRIVDIRERNFFYLLEAYNKNTNFIPLNINYLTKISNFAFPIICKNKKNYNFYKKLFISNNIEIRPILSGNINNQPFYKKYFKNNNQKNLNSSYVYNHGFYIPNNTSLSSSNLKLFKKLISMQ